jgi:hypothetical protein
VNKLKIINTLLLVTIFVLISYSTLNRLKFALSPKEVVALYDKTYGTSEMTDIAPYTTAKFRDNKPKEVWVIDTWNALKDMKYKRLDSELIDSKTKGNRAMVILESEIETVEGKTKQKELFYLIKEDGRWKIHELEVENEEPEEPKEKIHS